MLSEWHAPLKATRFDTEVYVYDGKTTGGTLLVCGGAHPNEPAAFLASVVLLENLGVKQGRVMLIPRANAAGFTHTDSQEAGLLRYDIQTSNGVRTFRNGSRFANPVFQWPDPSVYQNPRPKDWQQRLRDPRTGNPGPGGQTLSGVDSRNLNRTYPGNPNGVMTEQLAYAIQTLIEAEKVDVAIDLHEASPEYPTINVIVAHQRAQGIATAAELLLSDDGIKMASDPSAVNLRGLSHREWGDLTDAMALLMESANPSQGRLKGRTSPEQLTAGKDMAYYRAMLIQRRLNIRLAELAKEAQKAGGQRKEVARRILNVNFPVTGIPLAERIGRHIMGTRRLVESWNDEHSNRPIILTGLPTYREIIRNPAGRFLADSQGNKPLPPEEVGD
jgi:hypothetical protein